MNIFPASLNYFAIVFGAGFLLALIRNPWLVPRFDVRTAELMEMPIMLVAIFFAARWIARRLRFSRPPRVSA